MQIVRSKAKETLTEQETNFFTGIGEAVETAFNAESVERNKQIKAITEKLGTVDDGETFSEIIRNLSKAITDLENKTKRSFTSDERFKLKSLLEAKKDDIQRARKGGNPWEIEFRAKRAASALMTTGTVLTGGQAVNNVNVFEDMDITVIEYPKNFILDGINSRQVAKVPQTVARKEQLAESDGRVGVTSEGNAKPLTDKLFTWKYDTRKKYAGRIEMTEGIGTRQPEGKELPRNIHWYTLDDG